MIECGKLEEQYSKNQPAIQNGEDFCLFPGLNTFVLLMYKHLTREQRYVVYLELQRKTTQEVIAQLIGVSKSTVCREIKRNSTATGKYVRCKAQDMTEHRKGRTPGNRAISPILRWRVEQLIKEEQWSPRQRRHTNISRNHLRDDSS